MLEEREALRCRERNLSDDKTDDDNDDVDDERDDGDDDRDDMTVAHRHDSFNQEFNHHKRTPGTQNMQPGNAVG